ncbi:NAD-dependent epimerase/dehydratase family protein [Marinilongibacter aquaticus]|uniref:NAD-dependent epimerase/dehydratase family protein n=1 Tax=Marinilongibacter aquaticus TaxID=2975157 RepID=UPI0021BDD50B|nr:NAD-dependent epimerase/dehydratase family protein [Marinilongibacter aquaticus]UBM59281.1 NAD-dependent epimerase/dehydratase family protein [Marinilongibacter aquaticus]
MEKSILVIGACGQLGTALTKRLVERYGLSAVWPTDIRQAENYPFPVHTVNALNREELQEFVAEKNITEIYHLAAVLSANGEKRPIESWHINMGSLLNVLEVARTSAVEKVFFPSSIAVFNDSNQKDRTPEDSYLTPGTVYGLSKAAGENWAKYYFEKYGLDVRSIRYPGIIGYDALPGGGTTDYAVDIYHKAVKGENFDCFLEKDTALPMLFMDDATKAAIMLMEAPAENIKVRTSYNIGGFSLRPIDFYEELKKDFPNFEITYSADYRQQIANQWPNSLDDSTAKKDWGWEAEFDLAAMSKIMIEKLTAYYNHEVLNA